MRYISFVLAAVLFSALALSAYGGQDLEIGRMRVALWPEYDSTGVLYIYDGRFKNNEAFPNETSFFIPSGAVISDACSLSPKGAHFCQLYTQTRAGDADKVGLKLPYPNFYLSFHTDPFKKSGEKRVFHHVIKAAHRIEKLEVDLQSPLRTEGFKILSPAGFETSELKGFTHYKRVFENVGAGETIAIDVEYIRKDRRPSVDIKYMPPGMTMGGEMSMPAYRSQKYVLFAVYAAAVSGLLVFIVMAYLTVKSRGGHGSKGV